MKRCGLYVRVSTERQALVKEGSLETQEDRLRAYVKVRNSAEEEWKVIDVYKEAKSGKNADRPEYQRLISDVENGKINTVLCTKIDRISRSLLDFYRLYDIFQKYNVSFISLEENFDTSTPAGRAMLKITLVFAELEREQTSSRTKEKMAWRAEQGLWNGGQILGYDLDGQTKGALKPNKEEIELVNLIFKTYLETKSFRKTAEIINNKGYRTKSYLSRRGNLRGGNLFIDTTVSHILRNPVYIGKIAYKDKVFEGKHEPIVPLDLWQDVQKVIEVNAPRRAGSRKRTKHTYLLEGLLKCGWCDSYMTPVYCGGRNKKTYFYYQCTKNVHLGDKGCRMKYVPAEAIEEAIVNRIRKISADFNFISSIVSDADHSSREEIEILKKRKQIQEKKLGVLKQNIANWLELIGNGAAKKTNTTDVLLKRISEATRREKQIEGEITEIGFQIKRAKNKVINAQVMKDSLVRFVDLFDRANGEEKKDLIRFIVHKVVFTPEEIKYALYDRPPDNVYLDNPGLKESFALSPAYGEPFYELKSETSVVWLTEKIYYYFAKHRRKIGIGTKPEKFKKTKTNPVLRALKLKEILDSKKAKSKSELANEMGLSRVRITQIMNLLKLQPKIIQKISSIKDPLVFNFLTERRLRSLIKIKDKNTQIAMFRKVLQEIKTKNG